MPSVPRHVRIAEAFREHVDICVPCFLFTTLGSTFGDRFCSRGERMVQAIHQLTRTNEGKK